MHGKQPRRSHMAPVKHRLDMAAFKAIFAFHKRCKTNQISIFKVIQSPQGMPPSTAKSSGVFPLLSADEKFIRQTAGIVGVVKGHAMADMPGNAAVHSGTAELHVLQLACGIFMLQTCMTVVQAKAHLITTATRFDPAGFLHLFKKSSLPRGPCGLDKPRGDVAPANTAEGLAGPNSPSTFLGELPCKAAPVRLRPMLKAVSKSVSKSCSCSCNNLDAIKLWGNFGAQKSSIATGHMNTLLCPLPRHWDGLQAH